ncbi:hypothetical protein BJP40_24090 [Streptomyces sp. CC53]|uniref:hypothetical protein n=1 Tax=unclassified Streptomyces TaxID=2593676 RepID=UPI0008DE1C87|nr:MULTISPECIES: hypothetical protein [unclassified Streptomyces]OII63433.1 hypothetical protein BJP40_24090 [Streptomyces sp. CC53]
MAKPGCLAPEPHGDGRYAGTILPGEDCPLRGTEPHPCSGLLTDGVTLRTGPRPTARRLVGRAAALSDRCRTGRPAARRPFRREPAAFEALHGEWRGDPDAVWEILHRTYVAAVTAALAGGAGARAVQTGSGTVGAEPFPVPHRPPTRQEDTALFARMVGCAHPDFLWNGRGHAADRAGGDWLDG